MNLSNLKKVIKVSIVSFNYIESEDFLVDINIVFNLVIY